ncbi:MAG: HD domain-containing protein [Planctomycetales bacterium]|nr:HD domain-containing protein [Planctomycetales bacterium]
MSSRRRLTRADEAVQLLEARGDSEYGGEAVTQREHALQCALLAEQEHASPELIVAALLHDLGHMLHELADDAPDQGIDDRHEHSAAAALQALFPPEVTEPIRLHVAAKRYLCAVDPDYLAQLSQPSIVSLELQGGPMTSDEANAFAASPHADDAVRLRRWDDTAKAPGLPTPPLSHFAAYVKQSARPRRDEHM